jgi:hypothetical protein
MSLQSRPNLLYICGALLTWDAAAATGFQPILLSPESFTHDVIVEKSAPAPALPVTTASMESGPLNSGCAWFERGYSEEWPSAGLPAAGSTFASETSGSHIYRMPNNYGTKNAFLIDSLEPDVVLRFVSPSNYATLSFLTSSGVAQNVIGFALRHQNGTVEKGTFISPNWYSNLEPAWTAYGRVNTMSLGISDLNSYNPKLYSADVRLVDAFSPITQVDLFLSEGAGHTAVFAVSGAPIGAGPFIPIDVEGQNHDLVVEASAVKPGFLDFITTATVENGAANRAFTWYERGYNPLAPQTGLPPAGSLFTSPADDFHQFIMPPDYSAPNAILLDKACPSSEVTLSTPVCYSGLSFLTASGQGSVTNRCVVHHLDGSSETSWFVSPDWLGNTVDPVVTGACVSVSTRLLDQRNVGSPCLYAADVPVTNRTSKVTGFVLSAEAPALNAHSVILAVSGLAVGVPPPPPRPSLTISQGKNNSVLIHSSVSGRLETRVSLKGGSGWTALGPISTNLTLPMNAAEKCRFYRLVAP